MGLNSLFLWLFGLYIAQVLASEISQQSAVIGYLQSESQSITSIQQTLLDQLRNKYKISVGHAGSGVIRQSVAQQALQKRLKVTMSVEGKEIDCRISLGKIPAGRKAIAPCQCTGSQQWIQYSTYNKLRRKDPSQWKVCRTCQSPFVSISSDDEVFESSGRSQILASLLGMVLDHRSIVRTQIAVLMIGLGYFTRIHKQILKFLVSKQFWQQYTQWSRLVHLPLVLKLWGGRIALQYLWSYYLQVEGAILQYFTEIETALVEPSLVVNA